MKSAWIVLAGMISMLQLGAVTPEDIEAYAEFKDTAAQLELLTVGGDVSWGKEEVASLITRWADAGLRANVIKALAKNGFDLAQLEWALVIEWGGGGVPYRALYIADKAFLLEEQDKKIAVNELTLNDDIRNGVAELRKLLIEDQYEGVIAGAGADIRTYIVTAFDKEGGQTAIIYDAVTGESSEDTGAALKAIAGIKEKCNIAGESGA